MMLSNGTEAGSGLPDHTLVSANAVLASLVVAGKLTESSVERARQASAGGDRADKILVKLGLLSEIDFVAAWSAAMALPIATASEFPDQPVLASELPYRFLKGSEVLPLHASEDEIILAIADPFDRFVIDAVRLRTGKRVSPVIGVASEIREALQRIYAVSDIEKPRPTQGNLEVDIARLKDLATESPAIVCVQSIIERAVELRASDIHITTSRSGNRLRYRTDGVLRDQDAPPHHLHEAIISRVKVLADLDITEKRQPQDGRIRFGVAGREIDLRIATMPHLDGEGVVIRLLDRSAVKLDLEALGFQPTLHAQLLSLLDQPNGMFLVTGPTGSGKTTTLYAALRQMVKPEQNIVSVEDPVEFHLDGVAQVQIQRKIGLDFPKVLRAVLRQDPDVIMVGEIRDEETALIANQAAMTGHFVLATLHTNSAAASFPRLMDMGLEPYLLSSTIRGVLAQRLMRLLCDKCARPLSAFDSSVRSQLARLIDATSLPATFDEIRMPVGCACCNQSGYHGRTVMAELVVANDQVRQAILDKADAGVIQESFEKAGGVSLIKSGAAMVLNGASSFTELIRCLGESAAQ